MSFTREFTDPQGVHHEAAYFEVAEASLISNLYKTSQNSVRDGEMQDSNNADRNLRYKLYYWTSLQAKTDGFQPYTLGDDEPVGGDFTANELGSEYDQFETAAEAAEYHYLNNLV